VVAASTTELAGSSSLLQANANSSTSETVSSSVTEGTSSVPQAQPMNIDASVFQNIALPTSTPSGTILSIVYSTDGATWQPLVNIDSSNWQQARYKIPISSWQELAHLQVAFVGLGASSSPQIYLDAVGVEVSYVDTPNATTDITPAPDAAPVVPVAPVAPIVPPPTPTQLPPAQALKQIFDPFAGQLCSVTPFSESISAGGGGSFLLKLMPPEAGTSTKATSSIAGGFLYDASIGSLPDGISATIMPEHAGADIIGVSTAPSTVPGSYNVVVVYKERQYDGTIEPNFCQFNIVVTK
jgi:hypothetical protein